jgi:tetratricopeptide (TPR) repeat protein
MCLALFIFCCSALAYSSAADNLVSEGNAFLQTKNYTRAIAAYDQAIALVPDNTEAWNGKADALNRAGMFGDALTASDKALALDPNFVKGWINRGYILYNLGRYDDELKAYEMAISLDPGNAEAWFNKGYSLAGMKRYDEAIAAFDQVGKLDPAYPNLAANRHIAVQLRDAASTPAFVTYEWAIFAVVALTAVGIIGILFRRKKETERIGAAVGKKPTKGKGMRKERE